MSPVVLVVEDEVNIRELVCLHLGLEGFECVATGDGREALRLAAERDPDLVVLDLMIPGLEGMAVCRALRREPMTADVPILMLTARREESDRVLGLESGADDYLVKPFGIRELVARVRALLRRPRASRLAVPARGQPHDGERGPLADEDRAIVRIHDVEVDPARRRVRVGGREIELTGQEFLLLHLLSTHPGIVFSRQALLKRIWGDDTFVSERSADTLVKRLRQKIEDDPASPRLVLTVWGTGYKLRDVD